MPRDDHARSLEKWTREGAEGSPPVRAATVILLRDRPSGLETLMLKRNSKIAFGGMWVFPGGRLDAGDWQGIEAGDDLAASRRAAVREALEECGLVVDPDAMHPFSHWTPPRTTPRRFLTWFFAARAGEGEVAIDHGEIHESEWMRPVDALKRRDAREIELAPPTFVSLSELATYDDVDSALASIASRTPERFETVIGLSAAGPVALWHGDAGYASADPGLEGSRHRLTMNKSGLWTYERKP
ncbi:MAG TPA: NUDIX hydrolase [Deltaproteobacteria bacterium]|nr:NUDIX hydrolase [Deltaproteobacteria bacterium]